MGAGGDDSSTYGPRHPTPLEAAEKLGVRHNLRLDGFNDLKAGNDPMGLPYGMERLEELRKDFEAKGLRVAFFLDYDGTLSPIVKDPDRAVISEETREVVRSLAGRFTTAIVTGRSVSKVRKLVQLDKCYYAGSHGWDIEGPAGSTFRKRVGDEFLPTFQDVLTLIGSVEQRYKGAMVEDNVFSVSVHYRNCKPEVVPQLEKEVDWVCQKTGMVKKFGKKVFEIRPAFNWHKGKAVNYLLEALEEQGKEILPIYIGDDVTDEDAFKALSGRGISVIVADANTKRSTHADFRLSDPSEVRRFLSYFVERA